MQRAAIEYVHDPLENGLEELIIIGNNEKKHGRTQSLQMLWLLQQQEGQHLSQTSKICSISTSTVLRQHPYRRSRQGGIPGWKALEAHLSVLHLQQLGMLNLLQQWTI
jgi:hypothetical protein